MAKKVFLGVALVIILLFVGYDFYQNNEENSKPILQLVEEKEWNMAVADIEGKALVLSAKDHNGKNILDDEHLKIDRNEKGKKIEFVYTLTDDENRSVSKTIMVELYKPIKSFSNDIQEGKGTEKKENKKFYYKDYDSIAPKTYAEAAKYGLSALGKYKIERLWEGDDLVGYEVQFVE